MQALKDKRVIIGGAAVAVLLGVAFFTHYYSAQKTDPIKVRLDKIGTLKRDASGYIDFEQFVLIFESSSTEAKKEFAV